ncbi:hypothetical protein AB0333_15955 [Citricoccus sp. NPDC079358]|uniref:hypothetical protein n=1 Tax=Citricoccus sp. NPDC079358 TaxID=3154653 RepID=UPI003450FDEB
MAFEVFDKRSAPMKGTPSVTVQRRGIVSINGPAHKLIKGAQVVELLFDKERRVMAIRPAEPSARTYEMREPSKSGQTLVSAVAFMEAYDIDTTVSRRYEPFEEDGMLCINFNGPSIDIQGNRTKKQNAEEADERSPMH